MATSKKNNDDDNDNDEKKKNNNSNNSNNNQSSESIHRQYSYTLKKTSKKGRALVATRTIAVGERLGGADLLWRQRRPGQNKSTKSTTTTSTTTNKYDVPAAMPNEPETSGEGARPMVPPVLLEDRRETHCAVCFRFCHHHNNNINDKKKNNNNKVSSLSSSLYIMQICSKECQITAQQVGLYQEQKAIHCVLQQGRIPKILPTALLVYRLFMIRHWKQQH